MELNNCFSGFPTMSWVNLIYSSNDTLRLFFYTVSWYYDSD